MIKDLCLCLTNNDFICQNLNLLESFMVLEENTSSIFSQIVCKNLSKIDLRHLKEFEFNFGMFEFTAKVKLNRWGNCTSTKKLNRFLCLFEHIDKICMKLSK